MRSIVRPTLDDTLGKAWRYEKKNNNNDIPWIENFLSRSLSFEKLQILKNQTTGRHIHGNLANREINEDQGKIIESQITCDCQGLAILFGQTQIWPFAKGSSFLPSYDLRRQVCPLENNKPENSPNNPIVDRSSRIIHPNLNVVLRLDFFFSSIFPIIRY